MKTRSALSLALQIVFSMVSHGVGVQQAFLYYVLSRSQRTFNVTLREKCPYSELFRSVFPAFRMNTERYVFSPNAGKYGTE